MTDDIMRRFFAPNTNPTAADDLKRLIDRCDVPAPGETLGGKPRVNPLLLELEPTEAERARFEKTVEILSAEVDKVEAEHTRYLTAVFHNEDGVRFAPMRPMDWSAVPPIDCNAEELIAKMRKAIDDMNKHTPPGNLCDRIDIGKNAMAELRRRTEGRGTGQPGPHANDPLGVLTGIRIVLSDTLDDDQWIAYDRHGIPLALGRTSGIGVLVPPREPT